MRGRNMLCFVIIFLVIISSASTVKNTTTLYDLIKEVESLPSLMDLVKGRNKRQTFDNPYHPEDNMQIDSYRGNNAGQLDKNVHLSVRDVGKMHQGNEVNAFKKLKASPLYTSML